MDEEELLTHIDTGTFFDRYVEQFEQEIETDVSSTYEFDRILLAKGGKEGMPDEVV